MRSHDEGLDFKALLAGDGEVMAVLSRADLDRAFDLERQLRHAGPIVDRVLDGVESGSSAAAADTPGAGTETSRAGVGAIGAAAPRREGPGS